MSQRSTTKPSGPGLPHVLQLRMSDVQRRYLLYLAARDGIGQAEAVRRLLDRSLDRAPAVHAEGEAELPDHVRGRGTSLRAILTMIPEDGVAELAAQVRHED